MVNSTLSYYWEILKWEFETIGKIVGLRLTDKLTLLNSFYGTGKTFLVIEELKKNGKPFIFISPRITLLKYINQRLYLEGLSCHLYIDIRETIGLESFNGSICITPDSLHRMRIDYSKYVIVIDESVTVLDRLIYLTKIQVTAFQNAIIQAQSVIAMDKNFSNIHEQYFKELLKDKINQGNSLFIDIKHPINNRKGYGCKNKKQLQKLIINFLQNNQRIIIQTDKKRHSEILKKNIEAMGKKALLINGDTSGTIDIEHLDNVISENQYDVLIYTQSLSVGVSIELKNYFHAIFVFDDCNINSFDETEQGIHRYRDFSIPIYAYFGDRKIKPKTKEEIKEDLFEREEIIKNFLDMDYDKNVLVEYDNYKALINLYCSRKEEETTFRSNSRENAIKRFKTIVSSYTEIQDEKETQLETPDTTEKPISIEEKLKEVELLSEIEVKQIEKKLLSGIPISEEESLRLKKTKIANTGKLTNEDIDKLLNENQKVKNIEKVINVDHTERNILDILKEEQSSVLISFDSMSQKLINYALHKIFEPSLLDLEISSNNSVDILIKNGNTIYLKGYNLKNKLISLIEKNFVSKKKKLLKTFTGVELEIALKNLEASYFEFERFCKFNPNCEDIIEKYKTLDYTGLLLEILRNAGFIITSHRHRVGKSVNRIYKLKTLAMVRSTKTEIYSNTTNDLVDQIAA